MKHRARRHLQAKLAAATAFGMVVASIQVASAQEIDRSVLPIVPPPVP